VLAADPSARGTIPIIPACLLLATMLVDLHRSELGFYRCLFRAENDAPILLLHSENM
jgi:hypothetical protein